MHCMVSTASDWLLGRRIDGGAACTVRPPRRLDRDELLRSRTPRASSRSSSGGAAGRLFARLPVRSKHFKQIVGNIEWRRRSLLLFNAKPYDVQRRQEYERQHGCDRKTAHDGARHWSPEYGPRDWNEAED